MYSASSIQHHISKFVNCTFQSTVYVYGRYFSVQTAIILPCRTSFCSDALGTATICEILFLASKADLVLSKRQPVLLLRSRSDYQVKVETSNSVCKFRNGRIFSAFPEGRIAKTQMDAAEIRQRRRLAERLKFFIFLRQIINYIYINQQDAQNSCYQTLFSTRWSTCFGLYQSIFRSNFISCISHLVYACICR